MARQNNPFSLAKASDYTDVQINDLWVELRNTVVDAIIEPTSGTSKYILGGKGSGKTHILRYYSYHVARLREGSRSGIDVVCRLDFLALFLRATALDAARFEAADESPARWQQLFGVYLELRLMERLVDAMCDIRDTSIQESFDDAAFLAAVSEPIHEPGTIEQRSLDGFRDWLTAERKKIDNAVDNSAFSGSLEVRIPFSLGALCLPAKRALARWNRKFEAISLIYLVDEIENFSEGQQQVVNTLIRYGEGKATFRVTGRLYSVKTFATLGDGEENREGSEFKTTNLDSILRSYPRYGDFAKRFVLKRLGYAGGSRITSRSDPRSFFEEITSDNYFEPALTKLGVDRNDEGFLRSFKDALHGAIGDTAIETVPAIVEILTADLPLILQKLNILQFCKKHRKGASLTKTAERVRAECASFMAAARPRGSYATAYAHFKGDLFAQVCRESKKQGGVPYAGFETFVAMSSGNPRNLLIVLGRAYEIAAFREVEFGEGAMMPIGLQTQAATEAARFMLESDTSYGRPSDLARLATERLATTLRTARYALNIPEVSPLAVSFADNDLSEAAREVLSYVLNYSFCFEIYEGRPDRNSLRVMRKIQLNPILSPRWGLPIGRRGDLSLGPDLVNAIFDPEQKSAFELQLKILTARWANPFGVPPSVVQDKLF